MKIVKLGNEWVNMDYLIHARRWSAPDASTPFGPGAMRVILEAGTVLDLAGADAETMARNLDDAAGVGGAAGGRPPSAELATRVRSAHGPGPPKGGRRSPKRRGG